MYKQVLGGRPADRWGAEPRRGPRCFLQTLNAFSLGGECLKSWPPEKQVVHTPAQPVMKCAFPAGTYPCPASPAQVIPMVTRGSKRTGMEQMQEHGKGQSICLHTGTLSAGSKYPARRLMCQFSPDKGGWQPGTVSARVCPAQ